MDIIASMLAYLTCAAGVVAALVLSAFVFFAHPDGSAGPPPDAAVATHVAAAHAATGNAAHVAAANPRLTSAKPAPRAVRVAAKPMRRAASRLAANAAPGRRLGNWAQAQLSPMQLRRLQEDRARRWAYQQNPDFESRFMSYDD